jgi:hypothetical protein
LRDFRHGLGEFDLVTSSGDRFGESPKPTFASKSTTSTDAATRRSAFCKLIDCAIDPINGGPKKRPKYPADATDAIARPKPNSFLRAAAEKIRGIQFANPTPTNRREISRQDVPDARKRIPCLGSSLHDGFRNLQGV